MSVAHTPPASTNRQVALARVNNEQRRWFANTEKTINAYSQQLEAARRNIETSENNFRQLIALIREGTARFTAGWRSMRDELVIKDKEEALRQAESRWEEVVRSLARTEKEAMQLRLERFPRGPLEQDSQDELDDERQADRDEESQEASEEERPQGAQGGDPELGRSTDGQITPPIQNGGAIQKRRAPQPGERNEGQPPLPPRHSDEGRPQRPEVPHPGEQRRSSPREEEWEIPPNRSPPPLIHRGQQPHHGRRRDHSRRRSSRDQAHDRQRSHGDHGRDMDARWEARERQFHMQMERQRRDHERELRLQRQELEIEQLRAQLQQMQMERNESGRGRGTVQDGRYRAASAEPRRTQHRQQEHRGHSVDRRVGQQQPQQWEAPQLPPAPPQQRAAAQGGQAQQGQQPRHRGARNNPVVQRYLDAIPDYGQRAELNPYQYEQADENDHYYRTAFLHPFNEPPPPNTQEVPEFKKLDGLVPKFSGREAEFPAWVALFIPNIHHARCPVTWKASALYRALNKEDEGIRDIIDGAGSSPAEYARSINCLVRAYMHPEGILAARQQALDEITNVTAEDARQIRKWHTKLEQLFDTAKKVGRMGDVLSRKIYEDSIAKMDRDLARNYLAWCRTKEMPRDTLSVLAWLEEMAEDARIINHLKKDTTQPAVSLYTRRERDRQSPRVQRQRQERSRSGDNGQPPRPRPRRKNVCPLDSGEHGLAVCEKFKELSPTERRNKLREWRRCYSCLAPGHNIRACNRGITCNQCPNSHHPLLHGSSRTARNDRQASQDRAYLAQEEQEETSGDEWSQDSTPETEEVSYNTLQKNSKVTLQTVPVDLYSDKAKITVNLLMDSGATGVFMSKTAADRLQLTGHAVQTTITGFEGKKTQVQAITAKLQVAAQGEKRKH